jgi:hypothetical protein
MSAPPKALDPYACDPALHTCSAALHRPNLHTCGSRGKNGRQQQGHLPLIQNCRNAQLSFRKLRTCPSPLLQSTSDTFPLFLTELRVLLSFSLFFYPFPTTRRAQSSGIANPHLAGIATNRTRSHVEALACNHPSIPENCTGFPRAIDPRDEYNRVKENTAVFGRPCRDVECGQYGNRQLNQGCRDADQRI